MSTEKTPLASPATNFGSAQTIPFYVQDARRFYSRRRRERQLQCIMFITIVATFIMALIITISYSVNHPDVAPMDTNVAQPGEAVDGTVSSLIRSAGLTGYQKTERGIERTNDGLSEAELKLAVAAGKAAIAARLVADSVTKPLPSPSPNSRHQYAVSTSTRADYLALTGIAEIAATRKVENTRTFMGEPSSFGSYLDGGWLVDNVCANSMYTRCPVYAAKYRKFDGSCNHPKQKGMAFTPYKRVVPPDYADGIEAPRVGKFGNPLPSAREVSLKVHAPSPSSNPSFTVMLAVFGQFLDHDVTATAISQGTNGNSLTCCPPNGGSHPECFPVRVGPGDPVFDLIDTTCLEFVRSAPAPQCQIGPRQQLNQVTSFIDGSMIYGSDVDTAEELREFSGGRLRMQVTPDNRLLLPPSTNPFDGCNNKDEISRGRYCFASGDARANENLHLTTMHLLWARQHNLLANQLSQLNPQWDDETIYQESRRIVGAQLQHITYNEFLPIVLGESELKKRNLKPLENGFRIQNVSDVDPTIANNFAAAAFRFAHTLLPGLMKITDQQKGSSSYVQLHKMLFNPYSLYTEGGVESSVISATSNTIQKTSTHVTSQLTAHLFEDPLGNKTIPCGLDLVSLNIQRGRDHGLPGYTKWREYCGLKRSLKFDDLKDDMDLEALDSISKLYDNVDDIDLYTGALAEIPKGDGLLGPTFTCLIGSQFERLQQGDRFWYEYADQPGSFNQDQLNELRKTSLARLICDTSDGIKEVQALIMRSVSSDNPIMPCEDIPKVSLEGWKTEIPLLTLSETEVPIEDWLDFKLEVNQTFVNIISNIMSKKPPPGSLPADWLAFRQNINKTFTDLKDKFATLHPKIVNIVNLVGNLTSETNDFDWVSIKDDINNAIVNIIDSVSAKKPPSGSPPADWLVFRKKINDSLTDIRKKFIKVHPILTESNLVTEKIKLSDVKTIDWDEIKNNINATINDIVKDISASKTLPDNTPAAWFVFRKKINDTLSDLKGKFDNLYLKNNKPTENENEINSKATFDWIEFKDKLNKTLNDIITSIASKRPVAGSTPDDWLNFEKEINATFSQFMNQFSDIHLKLLNNDCTLIKDDFSKIVGKNCTEYVDIAITDIFSEINLNKPSTSDSPEDWLAYRQKINNTFTKLKKKYAYLYPKIKSANIVQSNQLSANSTFDVVSFRENLNKSLTDLINFTKFQKPGINSSKVDWLAYKQEIKNSVSKLKDHITSFTTNQLLQADYTLFATENDSFFNGNDWNKTIDEFSDEIESLLPSDYVMSINLQSYLKKSLSDLKNSISNIPAIPSKFRLMSLINMDWKIFKDRINTTIEDALDDVISNKPAQGDPSWINYNVYIRNRFLQMKDDINANKIEWLEKVTAATDMMILTKGQSVLSSASSMNVKLIFSNYYLVTIIVLVTSIIN